MADNDQKQQAEIARIDAERKKLVLEAEEISKRLSREWYNDHRIVIGGIIAAAAILAWLMTYQATVWDIEKRASDAEQTASDAEQTLGEINRKLDEQERARLDRKIKEQIKLNAQAIQQREGLDKAYRAARAEKEETRKENLLREKALLGKIEELESKLADLGLETILTKADKDSLAKQLDALKPAIADSVIATITLRSTPITLSDNALFDMSRERGFSLPGNGVLGNFRHHYESRDINSDKVVFDHATSLMWQQSGSDDTMTLDQAGDFIRGLNEQNFAGHKGWRLPTAEELISLVEPEQKNGLLFIDPKFDDRQRWIRSADKASSTRDWGIVFYEGKAYLPTFNFPYYIRAVRSL